MSDEEVDDFTRKLVEFMRPIIREFMEANFESWLESVKAEAWDEGFDAGQAWESDINSRTIPQVTRWDNPHRKEEGNE